MYKARIPDDDIKYPGRMRSKYTGVCKHCGQQYYYGDRVNWNPRVKGTACHAACYAVYGSPVATGENYTNQTKAINMAQSQAERDTELSPEVTSTKSSGDSTTLGEQLATAIAPYLDERLKGIVDREEVWRIAAKAVDEILETKVLKTVHTVELIEKDDSGLELKKDMGIQHKTFPLLLQTLQARQTSGYRLNVWLTGPAGTGKTTAAKACADALGLPFYFCGSIDTEYKLTGFVDAQGRVVFTAFREAYEKGGVFLFDECDSSLPAALLAFNAALANGEAAFPDGIIQRHKDFVCIAAANTWGLGATNDYVGRLKLDAAFLDRFVQISWDVDEALEMATAGNQGWTRKVQQYRAKIREKGIKVIVSPRASYFGSALLATGMNEEQVKQVTIRKAMTEEQWRSIQ